jgi:hypothetical protein
MSYSSAAATPGRAPVIRPSPITGAMASSTLTLSLQQPQLAGPADGLAAGGDS